MARPWIGVMDCNNFFVSCERLFRPDLEGEPVVVLSGNDGCVVARSQEVKDIGVPMGVPYFQVKDKLHEVGTTVFSSNFALYRDISRRVFTVMRAELDVVEQYSIDEAFFTLINEPEEMAMSLKNKIEKQVGIPVSIGIAQSKTQAKYASVMAKKSSGICVLNTNDWKEIVSDISLSQVWGIGGQLEMKYKKHNIFTVSQLLSTDANSIARVFGVAGVRLQQELLGNPVLSLHTELEEKQSITSSRSFAKATNDIAVLADSVAYHVRKVAKDLRAMKQQVLVLRVSLQPSRHGDFLLRGGVKEVIFSQPTADTFKLLKSAQFGLRSLFEPGVPYKKTGITLSHLSPNNIEQKSLFVDKKDYKSEVLLTCIDALNVKAGKDLVLLGNHLNKPSWQPQLQTISPAYTTRWSDIVSVKAQ